MYSHDGPVRLYHFIISLCYRFTPQHSQTVQPSNMLTLPSLAMRCHHWSSFALIYCATHHSFFIRRATLFSLLSTRLSCSMTLPTNQGNCSHLLTEIHFKYVP